MHSSRAYLVLFLAIAGCSSAHMRSVPSLSAGQKLSRTERIAHVLSRLTFGARAGDADRIAAMGVDRWIDQQLRPESIADSGVAVALAPIPAWSQPTSNLSALTSPRPVDLMAKGPLPKDSAGRAAELMKQAKVRMVVLSSPTEMLAAGKIIRAQVSERQLYEIVVDFWENHFSIYSGKIPSRESLILFDRDVLRPRALGKFRDLLGAVAHSPAMLFYLDNHLSTSRGLNENYARELLELHTLGVDGGYTQRDVIEVARALTGWTITGAGNPSLFAFRSYLHDTASKTVLGHVLKSGRGIEDGEEVLDIIARHPSTAHYISLKLARRLVSDEPPPSLVNRVAATFTRTDGDITSVIRTIVTSPEFFSRAAFRAKVKTPFELVVSARRTLDAPPDTTPTTSQVIAKLGQPIFGRATPDGWPEKGVAWMNSGTIYDRIRFAADLANGRAEYAPLDRWRDWTTLTGLDSSGQMDGVIKDVLVGCTEPATREAMLASAKAEDDAVRRLHELLAIALASPEFQRR